jgi:hypothetical protein
MNSLLFVRNSVKAEMKPRKKVQISRWTLRRPETCSLGEMIQALRELIQDLRGMLKPTDQSRE